jgi:hypothetical protein
MLMSFYFGSLVRKRDEYGGIRITSLIGLTFICSLIFSIVFITVQRIDTFKSHIIEMAFIVPMQLFLYFS